MKYPNYINSITLIGKANNEVWKLLQESEIIIDRLLTLHLIRDRINAEDIDRALEWLSEYDLLMNKIKNILKGEEI